MLNKYIFNDALMYKKTVLTGGNTKDNCAYCPVNCIFCFQENILKVNIPKMKDKLDYVDEKQLWFAINYLKSINYNGPIKISTGSAIMSSDPFSHPLIYKFLSILNKEFPNNIIETITSLTLLQEKYIDELNSYKNLILYTSLYTLDDEKFQSIFGKCDMNKYKYKIKKCNKLFPWIACFDLHTLEKDLDLLISLNPIYKRSSLIRLEYTKYNNDLVKKYSNMSHFNYEKCIEYVINNYKDMFYQLYETDMIEKYKNHEYNMLQNYLNKVISLLNYLPHKILFCCSSASYNFWSRELKRHDNVTVLKCENNFLGGTINNAGLLFLEDIKKSIDENIKNINYYDYVFFPKKMVDLNNRDLHNINIIDYFYQQSKQVIIL